MPRLATALRLLLVLSLGASGAAQATPGGGSSVLVKLRSEGPHAVLDCAEARSRRGERLASATADHSDSLDRLEGELGVRSVRAVFRRPDGAPFARQRERLRSRLRAAYAARHRAAGGAAPELPELAHVYRLELPPGVDARHAAARLQADPHVEYAQPNYAVDVDRLLDDPFLHSEGTWGQPYPDQWGPLTIDAPAAWDVSLGEGVVIAVVDTGVDREHPDIVENLWVNPGEDLDGNGAIDPSDMNGIDDDGNGFVDDLQGYDFQDDDADPQDENGHGSHVSGIAAARGDNGLGIAGVAPRATLMPVRTFPPFGSGETDRVWRGVLYAAMNGADVINASFSCGTVCRSNPIAEEVLAIASELGVVFVTSAGNAASDVMLKSPERLRESIVVGSLQPSGALAASSSFGFLVDVVAPGQDVLSLRASAAPQFYSPFGFVGDAYLRLSGTSMAAPHVSGVVALLLSANPALTPEEVRATLRGSALDLGEAGHDRVFGGGRVQPAAALEYVPADAQGEILSPLPGDTLDLDAHEFPIVGRVEGRDVASYRLEIGSGSSPEAWTAFPDTPPAPFAEAELARLPLAELPDGAFVLRLTLVTSDGRELREFAPISIDRNRPVLVSSPDVEAQKPDIRGRRIVWEADVAPSSSEDSDFDLFVGEFGVEGDAPLAAGPGNQTDATVSRRGVAWLEHGLPGAGSRTPRVRACDDHGRSSRCNGRDVTDVQAFRGAPRLSREWLVFPEAVEGLTRLRACRLTRRGCSPQFIAPEVTGSFAPAIDGRRLVWSGRTPAAGSSLFQCRLGWRAGQIDCPASPVSTPAGLPIPQALSGSLLAFTDLRGLTTSLRVCTLDLQAGTCPSIEIATAPVDSTPTLDVSRGRVVWDGEGAHGESDVFFCEYDELRQRCPTQAITHDPTPQRRPRIDGTRVVWEDERTGATRIASFELPSLARLRGRVTTVGWPVVIPLELVTGEGPVTFSASVSGGGDLAALGAHLVPRSAKRAIFFWKPREDQSGVWEIAFRATRRGGLYTEQSIRIDVRPRRSPHPGSGG